MSLIIWMTVLSASCAWQFSSSSAMIIQPFLLPRLFLILNESCGVSTSRAGLVFLYKLSLVPRSRSPVKPPPGAGRGVRSRGRLSLSGRLEARLSPQLLVEVPDIFSETPALSTKTDLALWSAGLAVLDLSRGESGGSGDLGGAGLDMWSSGAILTAACSCSTVSDSSFGLSSIFLIENHHLNTPELKVTSE